METYLPIHSNYVLASIITPWFFSSNNSNWVLKALIKEKITLELQSKT